MLKHHCIGLIGEGSGEIPVQIGLCRPKDGDFAFFGASIHLLGERIASSIDDLARSGDTMATHRSGCHPRGVVRQRFLRNASNPPPGPSKPAQLFWRFQPLPRGPARFAARKLFSPAN